MWWWTETILSLWKVIIFVVTSQHQNKQTLLILFMSFYREWLSEQRLGKGSQSLMKDRTDPHAVSSGVTFHVYSHKDLIRKMVLVPWENTSPNNYKLNKSEPPWFMTELLRVLLSEHLDMFQQCGLISLCQKTSTHTVSNESISTHHMAQMPGPRPLVLKVSPVQSPLFFRHETKLNKDQDVAV